jgi:hypothetical protein
VTLSLLLLLLLLGGVLLSLWKTRGQPAPAGPQV